MAKHPTVKLGRPFGINPPEKTHSVKIGAKAYAALLKLVTLEPRREYQTQRSQLELAVHRVLKANRTLGNTPRATLAERYRSR